MNISLLDSIVFLSICRDVLYESSEDEGLKYFYRNEASDYQIMGVLLNGELPVDRFNIQKENELWNEFREIVKKKEKKLNTIDPKPLSNAISTVGPVTEFNISTVRPHLEFIFEVDQSSYMRSTYQKVKSGVAQTGKLLDKGMKASAQLSAAGQVGAGLAGVAVAAIVAMTAFKVYKEFLSKAARTCKGKPDKTACMRQFQYKAYLKRIEKLRTGMANCKKAKNPENCEKSLNNKIEKLQEKADKLRTKK